MTFAVSSFTFLSFTTTRLRLSLRSLDDVQEKSQLLGVPDSPCTSHRPLSAPGRSESADDSVESDYDITTPSDS